MERSSPAPAIPERGQLSRESQAWRLPEDSVQVTEDLQRCQRRWFRKNAGDAAAVALYDDLLATGFNGRPRFGEISGQGVVRQHFHGRNHSIRPTQCKAVTQSIGSVELGSDVATHQCEGGFCLRRFRTWILRFDGLFNKRRKDRELDEEIESHLQMHIEDNRRLGMTPEEARRQAMIKLGGVESTKEASGYCPGECLFSPPHRCRFTDSRVANGAIHRPRI